MNTQTPFPGHDTPMPKAPHMLRVSFEVDADFLHEAQNVLSEGWRKFELIAGYIDLLHHCAVSDEFDKSDPRFIAAFDLGKYAIAAMAKDEGETMLQLFNLIEDPSSVGKAG